MLEDSLSKLDYQLLQTLITYLPPLSQDLYLVDLDKEKRMQELMKSFQQQTNSQMEFSTNSKADGYLAKFGGLLCLILMYRLSHTFRKKKSHDT